MSDKFKLVFATQNIGKFNEVKKMMPANITLLNLNDLNFIGDIKETGKTLKQNAKIKSDFIFKNFRVNCFADDTGLQIDSLNGMPGVTQRDLRVKIVILRIILKKYGNYYVDSKILMQDLNQFFH